MWFWLSRRSQISYVHFLLLWQSEYARIFHEPLSGLLLHRADTLWLRCSCTHFSIALSSKISIFDCTLYEGHEITTKLWNIFKRNMAIHHIWRVLWLLSLLHAYLPERLWVVSNVIRNTFKSTRSWSTRFNAEILLFAILEIIHHQRIIVFFSHE